MNKISHFAFLLFFFSPIAYLLFDISINSIPYALTVFVVLIGFFVFKVNLKAISIILIYLLFLLIAVFIALINNINVLAIFTELAYYLKPILFFLFGYYFIKEEKLIKLSKILLFWILFLTIIFYLTPFTFIHKAMQKTNHETFLHFYALKGRFLRNTSLLSPLELGFSLFFFSFIFYKQTKTDGKIWPFIISIVLLFSTVVRSAIIGFFISYICAKMYDKGAIKKFLFILFLVFLILAALIIFEDELKLIFLYDGSARIHLENFIESLTYIKNNIWGKGMGIAGWVGINSGSDSYYSEGSFFTSIIECGAQFIIIYIILGIICFRVSKDKMFPLFVGYMGASFLIPIGFSTFFNLLFFSYLGCLLKQNYTEIEKECDYIN